MVGEVPTIQIDHNDRLGCVLQWKGNNSTHINAHSEESSPLNDEFFYLKKYSVARKLAAIYETVYASRTFNLEDETTMDVTFRSQL